MNTKTALIGNGQIGSVSANSIRMALQFGTRAGFGRLQFTNPDCGQSGLPLVFIVD